MPRKYFHAIFILTFILFGAMIVTAQSGRKLPKGSPTVPTPTPTPELVIAVKPKPKPDFTLKVYSNIDFGSTFGFLMPERMPRWAIERLQKTPLLDTRDSGTLNRRDAIKQAKSETEAYVVLLELEADPLISTRAASPVQGLQIQLTVYHPVSAKVKFKRTLAMGQNSTGLPGSRNVLRSCNPSVYGDELLLLEASYEAADSVMGTFNVPLPPLCSRIGI
ncbi:MAG: hypothetical protein QM785_00475 [Pyrinomonadaceae bacterium]